MKIRYVRVSIGIILLFKKLRFFFAHYEDEGCDPKKNYAFFMKNHLIKNKVKKSEISKERN